MIFTVQASCVVPLNTNCSSGKLFGALLFEQKNREKENSKLDGPSARLTLQPAPPVPKSHLS